MHRRSQTFYSLHVVQLLLVSTVGCLKEFGTSSLESLVLIKIR